MRYLFMAFLALASPALADQKNYRLIVAGFNAGVLAISDNSNRSRYNVAAKVKSRGMAAFFGRTTYAGEASGRIRNGRLLPSRYWGTVTSGSASSTVGLNYRNGVPTVTQFDPKPPPEYFTLDFSSQRGTVDILSSAYWVFRERPRDELCGLTYYGFDGIRRTEISLKDPYELKGRLVCEGTYKRIAGFTERAMRRGTVFPIKLTYTPGPNGFILEEIAAKTVFGNAKAQRIK